MGRPGLLAKLAVSSNSNAAILESSNYSLKLEQYNNTNKVGFTKYGVADYTFNYEAPIGSWVHLAFVATETEIKLYADGALMDTIHGSNQQCFSSC
ncbi:MAG: LamG-like jellyroll fold domain-containing protein [Planctomycetota bacterium]